MEITFLGAAQEVGRSCIMLEEADRIMLDCGLKIHSETPYPAEPPAAPDAAIISHAHLDHSGFSPALFRHARPRLICTPPTLALSEMIIADSMRIMEKRGERPFLPVHLKKMLKSATPLSYRKPHEIGESTVTFYQAGHIPGAAFTEIDTGKKRVVYSGDYKLEETKTTFASEMPPENPDVLIMESTYFDREHPVRKELEIELGRQIKEVLENEGTVLLPAFAIGRTQELISIVRSVNRDVDIWVDGMGWKVSETLSHYSAYVKDFKRFRKDKESCTPIMHSNERGRVLKRSGVVIATAGMLQGGPALGYLMKLGENSKAIFTGYCVEETNGHNLINKGFVEYDGVKIKPKASWSYLDFSAHAGRKELFELVEKLSPQKIFCVHGDRCVEFASELEHMGYNASAPKLGETVEV